MVKMEFSNGYALTIPLSRGMEGLTVDFLTTGQASRPILDILLSRVTVRMSVVI